MTEPRLPERLGAAPQRGRRLRLNWFAPLPPAHTDIAHYTLRTVPALARHSEVVIWTDRAYWPKEIEAHADVRRWDGEAWRELNRADATLYHLGNNLRFHGWLWNVARRSPGVVVLHDTRLHEFFAGHLLEGSGGKTAYLSAVQRYHGNAAVLEAARYLRGEIRASVLSESLPMTEMALERARGAIVHTAAALEQVTELGHCPVLQLELPYPAGAPVVERAWDGVLRLVVFGYLSANRRIDALLDAIASFPERNRLSLDIFGEVPDPAALTARIATLGLAEQTRVPGFVREVELDQALDRAHLAINLRFPTMGEASGSQLRIWSRGLASVVSKTGWYGELPADTAWSVDPATEVADLHALFRRALAQPGELTAMGRAGRRYLEERHGPEAYASGLINGIEQMMATATSVIDTVGATVGRVLSKSGMSDAARGTVARRSADELARWGSS
jgi:glycosyltransferase involved in cell wall biosynthesis